MVRGSGTLLNMAAAMGDGAYQDIYEALKPGVREFPARVKCATLAWHTLRSALAGKDLASTE